MSCYKKQISLDIDPTNLFDSVLLKNVEVTDSIHVTQIKKYFYHESIGFKDKFKILKQYKPDSLKPDITRITQTYVTLEVYKYTGITLPMFLRMPFDEMELILDTVMEHVGNKSDMITDVYDEG